MTFYVYLNGRIVGTVIARNAAEATTLAHDKFGMSWLGWDADLSVEARRR